MNEEQLKNLRQKTLAETEELFNNLLEKIKQGSLGQAASRRFALDGEDSGLAVTVSLDIEVI